MRKLCGLTSVAFLSAIALAGATSASAATEVGSVCLSDLGFPNHTFMQLANAPGSPPLAAPSAGVVTRWKVGSGFAAEHSQQLKVLRPTSEPKRFTAVAESDIAILVPGFNTFETRLPVQAGDRFGVHGVAASSAMTCPTPSDLGNVAGALNTNAPLGTSFEYDELNGLRVDLSVVVEPDADGDGYGDESQDKCPRSAALQAVECPPITLGAYGLARKGSALILASASSQVQVSVTATAKVPPKKRKKGGKRGKGVTVTIQGGAKAVGPGQLAPFILTFPPSLRSALATTPPGKSLTLTATASTTDLAGEASSTHLTLKLKGQMKRKRKAKGRG